MTRTLVASVERGPQPSLRVAATSAVMQEFPRRWMEVPRHQRNHPYGATGRDRDDRHRAQILPTTSPTPTNASVDIKNPPPRSTAEVQAQALDEHNPHRRPRERPSRYLTADNNMYIAPIDTAAPRPCNTTKGGQKPPRHIGEQAFE